MTESEERAALLPCPFCGGPAAGYEIEPHIHALAFNGVRLNDHEGSYVIEGDCNCGSGLIGATQEEVTTRWNRRASSPPVPQQGAEAVAHLHSNGDVCIDRMPSSSQWPVPLYTAPPLEARLRDVKTNQEIDAMVREMKQPSDDAAIAELIPICSRVLAAFQNLGVVEHLRERYAARHECESAILALGKAIDAVRHAEPMNGEGA